MILCRDLLVLKIQRPDLSDIPTMPTQISSQRPMLAKWLPTTVPPLRPLIR